MILLYQNTKTNKIYTFTELKNDYEDKNNYNISINDDIFNSILSQFYKNIKVIDNDIIKLCNDYAQYMECERYLNKTEQEDSIKELFYCIQNETIDDYIEILLEEDNKENYNLIIRLLKEVA